MIILVINHKKKVLPMRYRERKCEFFAKRGMSLPGVSEIYMGKHHFADYFADGYSSQDNIQVFALLTIIRDQFSTRYPDVKKIIL